MLARSVAWLLALQPAFEVAGASFRREQRQQVLLGDDTEEFCSFNVFGSGDGANSEVASSSNVVFSSKSTLVVEDGSLRWMVFKEGSQGDGANSRCQEEAEVSCTYSNASSLLQVEEGEPAGPCKGHTTCDPDPTPRLSIMRSMIGGAVATLGDKINRIAMIGLGGGSIPLWFNKLMPKATVEAVDINADVIAAVPCMGVYESPRMKLVEMDGRAYLNGQPDGSYDALFLDAYTDENLVPNCLRTVEFFQTASKKLSPGGVFLMNVWRAEVGQVFTAMAKVFPSVQLGSAPGLGNLILLARSASAKSSSADASTAVSSEALDAARGWSADTHFSPPLAANTTYDDLIGSTMFLQTGSTEKRAGSIPSWTPEWLKNKLPVSGNPKEGILDAQICSQ